MFGMLDYRAHKLYWLLMLPVRVAILASLLATAAFVALRLGSKPIYHPDWLIKFFLTYIVAVIACVIVGLVWGKILDVLDRVFFWVVDVIPAKGRDQEEARAIVQGGPIVWLGFKLQQEIQEWTDRDTDALAAAIPWRWRLFNDRKRVEQRVAIMRDHYERTGQQGSALSKRDLAKMVAHLEAPRLAQFVLDRHLFSAVAIFVVVSVCMASIQN